MAGWSREKRLTVEAAFYEFLDCCYINSKDGARICLGKNLFYGQRMAITEIFDGLEQDIHDFYILKSRQLGISTITRALCLFFLGVLPGLQGAVVFDDDKNKNNARREIETMIEDLPNKLQFPGIKSSNRTGLSLSTNANLLFMSAGIRKSKSSGTLGRSVGISLAHLSELCNYDASESLESFRHALSRVNPNRLYIFESTGRGFNDWWSLWNEARKDSTHKKCIFIGWWSHPDQVITEDDVDYQRYGVQPPTDRELKKIEEVKNRYGFSISMPQLCWIRREMDPSAEPEGGEPVEYEGNIVRIAEQAWTEDDAFQITGSQFFAPESLTAQANTHVSKHKSQHMFACGIEFTDTKVHISPNVRMTELRVWEEPQDRDAVYIISADPAFGMNENNDRSAIQVLRCFADGLDQVAEYAWPLISTRQFAWVILAMCGWYAGSNNDVYLMVELNGPGASTWDEIKYLKTHITSGYQPKEVSDRGLKDVFRNVRNYIYTRPDSMSPGRAFQWKTSAGAGPSGKVRLMEGLRNFVSNGMIHIRSMETLEEMKSVTREGDNIETRGRHKDDRVVALALGVMCWQDRVRTGMSVSKRTRQAEAARQSKSIVEQANLFQKNQLESFFAQKRQARSQALSALRRQSWRSR